MAHRWKHVPTRRHASSHPHRPRGQARPRRVAPNRRHEHHGCSLSRRRHRVLQASRPHLRRPHHNGNHARPQLQQILLGLSPLRPLLAPHAAPRHRGHAGGETHKRNRFGAAEVRRRHDNMVEQRGREVGRGWRGPRGAVRVPDVVQPLREPDAVAGPVRP